MLATEVVPEFFPSDGFRVGMGGEVRLPPRLGYSPQLSGVVQHLLTIVALGSVQLTLHGMQLISRHLWHLDLHWRLRRWWLLLHLLHSC
jgi:hypothetical protein